MRRSNLWAIFLLIITIVLYAKSIHGEFVWDDHVFFVDNDILPNLRPWDLKNIFFKPINYWGDLMPVTNFFFVAQYNLFGVSTFGYHVFSILLYALIGNFAFKFLSLLYSDLSPPNGYFQGTSLQPLLCTALFLFHPAHVEAVAYIVGQKDLLYSLFSLLAIYWLYNSSKTNTIKTWKGFLPFVVFYYLSFLSKHLAVSTAFFIPAFWFIVIRKKGDSTLKAFLLWSLVNLPVVIWLFHITSLLEPFGITPVDISLPDRVLRGIRILGAHTELVFKPFPLNFGYPFERSWSPDASFWIGLSVICAFLFFFFRNRRSLVTVGLLVYVAYFLPISQVFMEVANATIYDRYLFIPLLGMAVVVERSLNYMSLKFTRQRWMPVIAGGVISLSLCVLTYFYIPKFRSNVASLEHAYRTFPDWQLAAFNYVDSLVEAGELDKAMEIAENERTLLHPSWVRDYFRGWVLLEKGDIEGALAYLEKASYLCERTGNFPYPNLPLGRALIAKGKLTKAEYVLKNLINHSFYTPIIYFRSKKLLEELAAQKDEA